MATPSPPEGSVAVPGDDDVRDMELLLDLSQCRCFFNSPPLTLSGEETPRGDGSWRQDGDLHGLDRRWMLWHEFMKEHSRLDAWLRLAEQAVNSQSSAHETYTAAKEELRKFQRLRREAASRLVQLDGLTRRNRTLSRLFRDAMRARLLASARECGRRWDDVNARLESITGRLQLFVSEWEGFEAQREELALWLADMDVRLSEVDHLTGSTCEKLRRLQSFQQCVCVNSGRVNVLLQRGEALIQRSEPADAQRVESRLLELLRRCSHVHNNIARTHTRLLSMRLVFEDDWILSQATDSGCPSETLLEEEGALDKHHLDLPATSHEHLGLEWDPSVDIGRSISRDDANSSYFSASAGLGRRDGLKRWSYLSSLDSWSDISNDVMSQEAHLHPEVRIQPGFFRQEEERWATSTPRRQDGEPIGFDGGRVKAWLGVQSSAPPERGTSCSRAVQTGGEVQVEVEVERYEDTTDQLCPQRNDNQRCRGNTQQPFPGPSPSPSHDVEAKADSDWTRRRSQLNVQDEEEPSRRDEAERRLSERSTSSSSGASSRPLSPPLLAILLAAALALLACLIWVAPEPACHRSNRMTRSFHLAMRYVNGPPPT
ncbi:uncharacterized protein [Embiotoca jacksoni]|uniref:uncharacterized protein n=1 Tax=Embiotoca jacksoni TaxID=100190 RepID=UPI0037038B67